MRAVISTHMKTFALLNGRLTVALTLVVMISGCGRNSTDAVTGSMERSFKPADPQIQQAVQQVNAELRAGNYPQAARLLAPTLEKQPLTDAQKQAVTATLKQINDAIAANPSLETAEMYQLRQRMFKSVYGQSRF
jgi:hypothetical protein